MAETTTRRRGEDLEVFVSGRYAGRVREYMTGAGSWDHWAYTNNWTLDWDGNLGPFSTETAAIAAVVEHLRCGFCE